MKALHLLILGAVAELISMLAAFAEVLVSGKLDPWLSPLVIVLVPVWVAGIGTLVFLGGWIVPSPTELRARVIREVEPLVASLQSPPDTDPPTPPSGAAPPSVLEASPIAEAPRPALSLVPATT